MLQTIIQTAKPSEADPVKKLTVMVTITNDSMNGFQASVQVMPAIFRERFSSMEALAHFFMEIQNWEAMQLPVRFD
ncbi:MAG: hypothetical protein RLZZ156_908 [Deinococcota bacterium]|jgi:hypothetical protein